MTMRPFYLTLDVADENTSGFASGVTAASGAAFTLAATAPTDALAHKVVITPSGSVTGNYTISGLDPDGVAISEVLATNTTSAVTSVLFYASDLVVLAPSGLGAETVNIGWADEVASRTIPLEWRAITPPTVQVTLTGTANFDMEVTNSDIRASTSPPPAQSDYSWLNDANFTNKSASLIDNIADIVRATRLVINSYSSGALIELAIVSPR